MASYQEALLLEDYRHRPHESPWVWCLHCQKLSPLDSAVKVMTTIFRVEETGVFPFGICNQHESTDKCPADHH